MKTLPLFLLASCVLSLSAFAQETTALKPLRAGIVGLDT